MRYVSGPYTSGQLFDGMNEVELWITKECLKFTNLAVTDDTFVREASRRIMDMSEGRNDFVLDANGIPGVYVLFMPDGEGYMKNLSKDGTICAYDDTWQPYHPAFMVGGSIISEDWIGKYPCGRVGTVNYGCSLYGLDPAHSWNYDQFKALCDAGGGGFHLMTAAEGALMGLLALHDGFEPRGNDYYGKSYAVTSERGATSYIYKDSNRAYPWRSKCGSGPVTWRLGGSPHGVSDLRGNVWEWQAGYRTMDGELQFIPDNDAADSSVDTGASGAAWKAMLPDGSFVAPGTEGTYKWDYKAANPPAGTYNAFELATGIVNPAADGNPYGCMATSDIGARDGVTVHDRLVWLGVMPGVRCPSGRTWMRSQGSGERLLFWGGSIDDASGAGLGARYGYYARTDTVSYVGGRRAFFKR